MRDLIQLIRDRDIEGLRTAVAADPAAARHARAVGECGRLACLEWMLAHGADEANGKPLRNDLIRWGQIPQALWLLERNASPNVPDAEGWTAVHQAASRGNERLLRAVLASGGDPKLRDRLGRTPRDVAKSEKAAGVLRRVR